MIDDHSIFTADTILGERVFLSLLPRRVAGSRSKLTSSLPAGQSTAVFSDLSTYLHSLRRLVSLDPSTLYPAHGPVIIDGRSSLETYLSHRQAREDQIVALLKKHPPSKKSIPGGWVDREGMRKGWSNEEIVLEMYQHVGFILRNAASRGGESRLSLQLGFYEGWIADQSRWFGLFSRSSSVETRGREAREEDSEGGRC